jgi:hypothetical protein
MFEYRASCDVVHIDALEGDRVRHIESLSSGLKFGLAVSWAQSYVSGPGTYPAIDPVSDPLALSIWMMYPAADDPSELRSATVTAGSGTFTSVG